MAKEGRIVDGEWWPPTFFKKNGGYYWKTQNKWVPLGRDYSRALASFFKRTSGAGGVPQSVAALLVEYIADRRSRGRSHHTLSDYDRWSKRLTAVFGHMPCDLLTSDDLRGYIDARLARAGGARQIQGEIALIRSAYRWGRDKKRWLDVSPADELEDDEIPRAPKRTHLPTCADVETFWCHAPPAIQAYVPLKLALSTRQEDLLALRADQVTGAVLELRIQKTCSFQRVTVSPGLRGLLDDALALPRKEGWLFESRTGEPYVDFVDGRYVVKGAWHSLWQRAKQTALLASGGRFTPFIDVDLRALAARRAFELGDLARAQATLAHGDPTTTKGYFRDKGLIEIEPLV